MMSTQQIKVFGVTAGVKPGISWVKADSMKHLTNSSDPVGPVSVLLEGVDEIGVYYKKENSTVDKWTEIDPEIVNYKSGGWVKSTATHGIVKQDRNGHIDGNASQLVLSRGTSFLLYVPEGVSPVEYQLLRLRINSNNREFRSQTGGVFNSETGAQRDFLATVCAPSAQGFYYSRPIPPEQFTYLLQSQLAEPSRRVVNLFANRS